jgi:CBS domain containing-hemolysin-like protein
MIEVLLILAALALVAACGAFVAAEFALVTIDRSTVEREAERGDRKARGVLAALRSLSTQLSGAQVGITVTNLLIGFLAQPAIAAVVDGPLGSAGLPEGAIPGVALAIALVIATGVTMVFGELVPKNLAIARPLATARAVQGFQRGFTRSAGPLIRFFNGTANRILRRLGIEPQEELASARSPEELASLVRRSAEKGTLEIGTATLLQRSLAFGERRAHDVMSPRGRMSAIDVDAPVLAVIAEARSSGHSRFPVLRDGDEFVGVVHIKHAVSVPYDERESVTVGDVMAPPLLVPASLELDGLLETLRRGGLQMALVVDEFGNVDGLVTLEDLVEEIVGEVRDEHDARDNRVRIEGRHRWTLSGLLRPDEVRRLIGVPVPEDEAYETLGGLVAVRLARMPQAGDIVRIEPDEADEVPAALTLTVLTMDALRVDRVRLERHPAAPGEPSGDGTTA